MVAHIEKFHASYTVKKLLLLFIIAFMVRAVTFYTYLQHEERYHQSDSMDYHVCALGLHKGIGLRRLDNRWPMFWRTPGYPLYLAAFYSACGVEKPQFNENSYAQKFALWIQILLSSLTPILIFFLVLSLVPIVPIAWLISWIFVFHPGFVLASGYLLTEALAVPLFFIFLIFLYRRYCVVVESSGKSVQPFFYTVLSALALGAYTWMRPMGQFIGIVAILFLLCAAVPWQRKFVQTCLFALIFFGSLAPWVIRNYQHTGKIFFWPGSGSYLASFNVPKIVRRLTGDSFGDCHARVMKEVVLNIRQEYGRLQREEPHHFVSQELVCAQLAWPWITKYPWYFAQDWMREVCKTTFDLYGSQLVNFARKTYTFDPMEEFLEEKLADCIYKQPMHWFMRFLCLFELLCAIIMWIGILVGFFIFFLKPLWLRFVVTDCQKKLFFVWLKAGVMVAVVLGMTGGFGYARLRMPIEPLLVLLSVTYWYYFLYIKTDKEC